MIIKGLTVVGLLAMLLGALDPLEGSVVILGGAAMVALAALVGHSRHRALLSWAFALVAVGVATMFAVSAIGGFGGRTGRSMWWALLLVPYPAGWILGLVGAVRRLREA